MGSQAVHHFGREWKFVFTQPWNYMTICFIKFTHHQFGDPIVVDQFRNIFTYLESTTWSCWGEWWCNQIQTLTLIGVKLFGVHTISPKPQNQPLNETLSTQLLYNNYWWLKGHFAQDFYYFPNPSFAISNLQFG